MSGPAEDAKSEHMKATVGEIAAIISRMEADPLRDLLADDVVMEFPYATGGVPDRVTGADAVVEAMKVTRTMFSAFRQTPTAIYASPVSESVIVEAESEGEWLDGGHYANRYAILFTFRDGKVVLWREYFDPLRLGKAERPAESEAVQ